MVLCRLNVDTLLQSRNTTGRLVSYVLNSSCTEVTAAHERAQTSEEIVWKLPCGNVLEEI